MFLMLLVLLFWKQEELIALTLFVAWCITVSAIVLLMTS